MKTSIVVALVVVIVLLVLQLNLTKQEYWKNRHKDIHRELSEALQAVQVVLSKYNVSYFAHDGTLLGAIRHGGFIPWDDDIDLCILNTREWKDNIENIKRDLKSMGMKVHYFEEGDFLQVYKNDYYFHIDLFVYDRRQKFVVDEVSRFSCDTGASNIFIIVFINVLIRSFQLSRFPITNVNEINVSILSLNLRSSTSLSIVLYPISLTRLFIYSATSVARIFLCINVSVVDIVV